MHFVLVAYTQTGEEMHHTSPAMRGLQSECAVLLRHWLGETAVFSHDPYELDAWLQALLPTDDAGPVHAEVLASGTSVSGGAARRHTGTLSVCVNGPWKTVTVPRAAPP